MIWYKSCPRCSRGDLYLDEDDCKHCLQCGYTQGAALQEPVNPELSHSFKPNGEWGSQAVPKGAEGYRAIAI